ncbi:MAG: LCP family protein [Lachnospiraceae bacterium]|nr:LCP family protein [Lachnospiraceae bacterium]
MARNTRYQEEYPRKKKKKTKRKRRRQRRVILSILLIFLALVALVVAYGWSKYGKMNRISIRDKDVKINDLSIDTKKTLEGFDSIALFGLDNRSTGNFERGNSDTIIVVSINRKSGEIRMASVYRDTYLDIGEDKYRKANAAYANGGPKQAIEMLNKNLDLDITDYVSVDFSALVDAIDSLGGIELDITPEEAEWLNGYIVETNEVTGHNSGPVSPGTNVHVDGVQATSYARIRYVGLDYQRTERQRTVITKMFEKAKQCDILTLNSLLDKMLPQISTSLSMTEILGLAGNVMKYQMGENTGFPFDKETPGNVGDAGDAVVPVDLANNVAQLHKFLYGNESYTPSETVKGISETIRSVTGY